MEEAIKKTIWISFLILMLCCFVYCIGRMKGSAATKSNIIKQGWIIQNNKHYKVILDREMGWIKVEEKDFAQKSEN